MFRTAAPRGSMLRPLASNLTTAPRLTQHVTRFNTKASLNNLTGFESRAQPLALTAYRQNTALVRSYASKAAPGTTRDAEFEKKSRDTTVEANPGLVSSSSSVHPAFAEVGVEEKEDDTDMMAGIRHDVNVIKSVFNLDAVPKEALRIGLAGVIPYLLTSTATVACAFEMNAAHITGSGFLMNENTAEALLHVLEPVQVGYGAVILSCLGTIHWGLEWAKYGGTVGYKRYMIGVLTPAIAWPTVLMPVEYALITQFLAFNTLYAVDSSTVTRGWTPQWYGTYRFLLTFVVGASIIISLIGRGQIQDRIGEAPTAAQRVKELQNIGMDKVKKATKDEDEEDSDEEE